MSESVTVGESIWRAAGALAMEGGITGRCRTCGATGVGLIFRDWVRDTFTDHDKLTWGEIVCHACQFCFTDRNTPLTARTGKDKPQRMRNYSHFVVRGEWLPLSKGAKRRMLEALFEEPEAAVIAESGQKHIIFRARPGWWQFEELAMRPSLVALERLLPRVRELMEGGFAKAEIETGRYLQYRVMDFGVSEWRVCEAQIKGARGTPYLKLALFLAQKEESASDGKKETQDGFGDAVQSGLLF